MSNIHDDIIKGQMENILHVAEMTGRKDVVEKAMTHKFIRKEPDGKGGWNYIYNEEDKYKISEDDKYLVDELKESKLNFEKAQAKYNYQNTRFELRNLLKNIVWPKIDWEDYGVSRGTISEEHKREGKPIFDKYSIDGVLNAYDEVDNIKGRVKRITSTFSSYKEELEPIKDQVSEIKRTLKDYFKYFQEYTKMKDEYGYF